jgi:hypothetical protein
MAKAIIGSRYSARLFTLLEINQAKIITIIAKNITKIESLYLLKICINPLSSFKVLIVLLSLNAFSKTENKVAITAITPNIDAIIITIEDIIVSLSK